MAARALWIALILAAFGVPSRCDCPKDPFHLPPEVVQFEDEVGARPVNIVVRELHLVNVSHATVDEQQQVAASLSGFCFREDETGEVADRIRDAFLHLGFFKAKILAVKVEAPDLRVNPPTVSITAQVEDGPRCRLRQIKFTGNKAITNTTFLRNVFPIQDGDIFDVEMVHKGLDNLRDAYGALGHINFTPVPNSEIDDEKNLITVTIDLDEGAQFSINSLTLRGTDPILEAALRAAWPEALQPGKIYNPGLVKLFLARIETLLPPYTTLDQIVTVQQNWTGPESTVDIVLGLEPD